MVHFRNGMWVAAGQILSVLTALFLMRLMTECVDPQVFGMQALLVGVVALMSGVLYQPLAQAALRFIPAIGGDGTLDEIRRFLCLEYSRRFAIASGIIAIASFVDVFYFNWLSFYSWLLMSVLLAVDGFRSIEVIFRNSSHSQAGYALYLIVDSIARLGLGVFFAWGLSPDVTSILLGYVVGGVVAIIAARAPIVVMIKSIYSGKNKRTMPDLVPRILAFSRPLTPVSIMGWLSASAERYVIASAIGPAAAGLYVAAQGFAAKPYSMMGTIAENTFRPDLYRAVTNSDAGQIKKVINTWLFCTIASSIIFTVILFAFSQYIVLLFLAEEYRRHASVLMPIIGTGCSFAALAQIYDRIAYAYHRAGVVVLCQFLTTVMSIAGSFACVYIWSIEGAAISAAIFSFIQMCILYMVAKNPKNAYNSDPR